MGVGRVNICPLCNEHFRGMGHNGEPLTWKRVCDGCNLQVIQARMDEVKKDLERRKA